MWFIFSSVLLTSMLVLFGKRVCKTTHAYTAGVFFLFCVTAVASVCLSQTYILSVTPGYHDGIGISNRVAQWIIGETHWSSALFWQYFTLSVYVALGLLLVSVVLFLWESRLAWKQRENRSES
ncbi:hypothetical protein [Xylanibacillus composti]|uniref:Uncharacterized protein n=1 Tax=Xylanibacillus composti TaxID=1572762 RepID=A0A8J4H4G0_9BACL|nr:hypothetical protein [Xylanibacillus composti]GIQ69416.1 hypothetical protein XYCOK13_22400 [Xylanibacillus composti]